MLETGDSFDYPRPKLAPKNGDLPLPFSPPSFNDEVSDEILNGHDISDAIRRKFRLFKANQPERTNVVIDFPGMSDYRVYENFGSRLYELDIPGVKEIYDEAAAALGLENLEPIFHARFSAESYFIFKVAFATHSLAHYQVMCADLDKKGISIECEAFSGLSIGMATAAIAAGAISLTDYINYLKIVTPFQQLEAKHVSITLEGEDIHIALENLINKFPDIEITKISSDTIVSILIHQKLKCEFQEYCSSEFGDCITLSKIRAFPVATHTPTMLPYLQQINEAIDSSSISFAPPKIPIISGYCNGKLETAVDVREALLSILWDPIDGITFYQQIIQQQPVAVLEVGAGKNIAELFELNKVRLPIAFFDNNDRFSCDVRKYAQSRVAVATPDLHLDLLNTSLVTPIPMESFLTNTSRISDLQRLRWFASHPTDVIYGLSKKAKIENVDLAMQQRIHEVMYGDKFIRDAIYRLLTSSDGRLQIPFGNSTESAAEAGWTLFGRSISKPVILSDGTTWSLVFKGAGTQSDPSCPIQLAPQRMDYVKVPNHKPLEPQPSWVLRGGEALHCTRNEIINAYGLRAAYSFFGENADTAVPIGAFKVEQIPTRITRNSQSILVPTRDYFIGQYETLNKQDQLRFIRYLRIDMEDNLSAEQQTRFETVMRNKSSTAMRELVIECLERWTPVVYGYLVKGDVNARVERWHLNPSPFKLERTKASKTEILSANNFDDADKVSSFECKLLAERFAKDLGRAAYYHTLGGDFGSKQASLTPKDVTVTGSILDLHANMLAGAGGGIYRRFIHPVKRRWNIENGKLTVKLFSEALDLDPISIMRAINTFEVSYKANYSKTPNFDSPYHSPFLFSQII